MAYLTGQVLTQADIAALFTSGTYTPTLGAMVIGTGGTPTNTAKYTFVGFPAGGVLTVEGKIKFGTTGVTLPAGSTETISLPSGYAFIDTGTFCHLNCAVSLVDITGGIYDGSLRTASTTTVSLFLKTFVAGGVNFDVLTATTPFTWAINDEIYYRFSARCTGP